MGISRVFAVSHPQTRQSAVHDRPFRDLLIINCQRKNPEAPSSSHFPCSIFDFSLVIAGGQLAKQRPMTNHKWNMENGK
jgi:hypothetical protein